MSRFSRYLSQAKGAQELMHELSALNTRIENVTTRWEVATGQDRQVLGSMLIHLNGLADQVRQDLQFFRGELPSYKHVPLMGSVSFSASGLGSFRTTWCMCVLLRSWTQ